MIGRRGHAVTRGTIEALLLFVAIRRVNIGHSPHRNRRLTVSLRDHVVNRLRPAPVVA
jgi:hypothetical protein